MRISAINNISFYKQHKTNNQNNNAPIVSKEIKILPHYTVHFKGTLQEDIKNDSEIIYKTISFLKKEAEDIKKDAKYQGDMAKFTIQAMLSSIENASKTGYQTEYENGRMTRLYEMHEVNGKRVPRAMYQFGENGTLECILDITDTKKPTLTQLFHGSQYIYTLENGIIKEITLGARNTDNTTSFRTKYLFENGELTDCTDNGITHYYTILENGEEKRIAHTSSEKQYKYENGETKSIDFGKYETDYGIRAYDKSIQLNGKTIIYSEGYNEHTGGEWGKLGTTIVIEDRGNGRFQTLEFDEGWNYEHGYLFRGKSVTFDKQGKIVRFNTGYSRELKEYAKSNDWQIGPKECKKSIKTIQGHNIVALNGIPEYIIEKFYT